MNTEVKDYLCQLGEAIREDIDESGAVFDKVTVKGDATQHFISSLMRNK